MAYDASDCDGSTILLEVEKDSSEKPAFAIVIAKVQHSHKDNHQMSEESMQCLDFR